MDPILNVSNLRKSFGAVIVADDLSFTLRAGEALGVIGPNGAGKTSMFNLITGTLKADAGKIEFGKRDISAETAANRCRAGIARSFQVPQPFSGLSVFENALVAATQAADLRGEEAYAHCLNVVEQTGLAEKANTLASKLTLLDRKRLELTRALCAKPKLLLLDEIAGGLTEAECTLLIETIQDVRSTGISIIWIEHVVHALLAVVERLMVIDFGRKIGDGDPKMIMDSPQVKEIYLGIEADA
ncbi:MAG: ABC transporter ATP-binding protein [Pseudomonadota bacterium]